MFKHDLEILAEEVDEAEADIVVSVKVLAVVDVDAKFVVAEAVVIIVLIIIEVIVEEVVEIVVGMFFRFHFDKKGTAML